MKSDNMEISEKEYFAQRRQKIQRRQRILTIVSIVSFVGSIGYTTIPALLNTLKAPQQENASTTITLEEQIKGYELILQREPNNKLALEKLSSLRLEQNALKASQQEKTSTTSVPSQEQIKEYELTLQREPNNQVALEELSLHRLRQKDTKGAIVLLEKLVKLYPNNQYYKRVLEDVKSKQTNSKQ